MSSDLQYEYKIEKALEHLNLDAFRVKMLTPLQECEILEQDVEEKYRMHCLGAFFPLRCHEKAFDYLFALSQENNDLLENVRLVQGLTWRFQQGCYLEEHSWIEINESIVFDGVLQKFYKRECFREKKCYKLPVEFTFEEAIHLYNVYGALYFPDRYKYKDALQTQMQIASESGNRPVTHL